MVAKITIIIQKQRMRDQELSFSQRLKQPRFNPGIRDWGQKKTVAGNLDFPATLFFSYALNSGTCWLL